MPPQLATAFASPSSSKGRPLGFQITPSDLGMIRAVYNYRFLHADHLSALSGRSYKKVHGRLYKLLQNGFLGRIEMPFQRHLYVLGRQGIDIIVEQGIASREMIEWRLRHHELKELFLKHQLMLVDLHCLLDLAGRDGGVRLKEWREGKELWDKVTFQGDGGRISLPVCPDAFFVLRDEMRPEPRNRLNFFLEADRSTTTHKRFQNKLIAYWRYLSDGLQTKKFGIKTLRVVTFALTRARALGLCQAAREVLPAQAQKYFLFASAEGLSLLNPEAILSDVFLSPRDPEGSAIRHRFVPPISLRAAPNR